MATLREHSATLLTILEVLIHDPLYKWMISPRDARERQTRFIPKNTHTQCLFLPSSRVLFLHFRRESFCFPFGSRERDDAHHAGLDEEEEQQLASTGGRSHKPETAPPPKDDQPVSTLGVKQQRLETGVGRWDDLESVLRKALRDSRSLS